MHQPCLNCRRSCLVVGLLVIAGGMVTSAQIERATLTGTVTDTSGAVVPNAAVEAMAQATALQQETKSNSAGVYRVSGLAIGMYTVTVSHPGFETIQYKDVQLLVGQTRTLDAQLKVGAVAEKIVVEATSTPLEETSPELSGVIKSVQIESLPVNGRNWASLLVLAPGALDDGGGDQRTIRFAGRGRDDNNYTMDGVDATGIQEQAQKSTTRLQISQDAVAEYRVNTMLYTAEHGAGAGGQVDLVSKTGSNEFHGGVFEFFRNNVLDSRAFNDFDAFTGKALVPPFHLNQFGGSLGGPIIKDKTFFFMDYEGLRQVQSRTLVGFVPAVPLRAAIVAKSPVLTQVVNSYPAGNVTNFTPCANVLDDTQCIDEFVHQGLTRINEDSFLIRLDHKFTDKTSLYVRVSRDISFTAAPLGNLLDLQKIDTKPANYIVALQHTFSGHIFNEAKFGINRAPYHNPQASVFPTEIDTNNFDPLFNNAIDNEVGTTFGYIDNLAVTRGRHTFKTGIEVRRVRLNQGVTLDDIVTFTTAASLINNQVNLAQLRDSWCCRGTRHTYVLPYFQDEWKLRPNLTLNLGIRWEYYSVLTEAHGRTSVFDLTRCKGFCAPGSPLYFPNYRNWDPRVGVAWAPRFLHDKTVIRSGFGIYHGAGQNDDLNAAMESNAPRILVGAVDIPTLSFPVNRAAIPAGQFQNPRAIQRDRRDLYVEQWGLSMQQALPWDFVFQSSYMGSHGVRNFARTLENLCLTALVVDPATGNSVCQKRPLPSFGVVDLKRNDGNSTFHALSLSLQRSFTHGWLWEAQYLYSHAINDGSIGGGEANAPENVNCRACEKGPSVFDIRHNFVASSVYDLPIGPGRRFWNHTGFVGKFLEGWSLSGIGSWHTGHPLTVLIGLGGNQIPDGNDQSDERPDLVPGVPIIPSGQNSNNWINVNAFTMPPTNANGVILHFGNAGRGLVRAPHVWQINMALTKMTKLTEGVSLEFRAEAFNVLNHVQLGDPSSLDILSGSFGFIDTTANFNNNNDNFGPGNTGSGLPRQIEFMLRLRF